jgi:hypothetical protein
MHRIVAATHKENTMLRCKLFPLASFCAPARLALGTARVNTTGANPLVRPQELETP